MQDYNWRRRAHEVESRRASTLARLSQKVLAEPQLRERLVGYQLAQAELGAMTYPTERKEVVIVVIDQRDSITMGRARAKVRLSVCRFEGLRDLWSHDYKTLIWVPNQTWIVRVVREPLESSKWNSL